VYKENIILKDGFYDCFHKEFFVKTGGLRICGFAILGLVHLRNLRMSPKNGGFAICMPTSGMLFVATCGVSHISTYEPD
jgi:hypothetical protein